MRFNVIANIMLYNIIDNSVCVQNHEIKSSNKVPCTKFHNLKWLERTIQKLFLRYLFFKSLWSEQVLKATNHLKKRFKMNNPIDGAAQGNTEVIMAHSLMSSKNSSEFDSTMNIQVENSTQASVSNSSISDGSKFDSVNDRLLSWGCGEFGQHGHGHTEDVLPGQAYLENFYRCCGMDVRIKAISCGGSHTVIITGEIKKQKCVVLVSSVSKVLDHESFSFGWIDCLRSSPTHCRVCENCIF